MSRTGSSIECSLPCTAGSTGSAEGRKGCPVEISSAVTKIACRRLKRTVTSYLGCLPMTRVSVLGLKLEECSSLNQKNVCRRQSSMSMATNLSSEAELYES